MERRRELRLRLALQVRVSGTDFNGKSFEQDATTVDLTPRGVRLRGICHPIEPGLILQIQHGDSQARFCVRWVGESQSKDHIGLELLEGEKIDWGRAIPHIPDYEANKNRKQELSNERSS